jgi:sec-independent protein translocase protein TatB
VFNLSGSEIIVILLLALVILGPEKLPEAMRKAGRAYSELRKMANSFQSEVRSVLDEPMEELRGTADALREATSFTGDHKPGTRKPAQSARDKPAAARPQPVENAAVAEPEPDSPAVDDVFADDADHGSDTGDADEDVITRTLSGDVAPHDPPDQAGPAA